MLTHSKQYLFSNLLYADEYIFWVKWFLWLQATGKLSSNASTAWSNLFIVSFIAASELGNLLLQIFRTIFQILMSFQLGLRFPKRMILEKLRLSIFYANWSRMKSELSIDKENLTKRHISPIACHGCLYALLEFSTPSQKATDGTMVCPSSCAKTE